MLKKLIILTAVVFVTGNLYAQFGFSSGGSLFYGVGKVPDGSVAGSEKPELIGYGVMLYPRYTFAASSSGAPSIGVPATVGLGGSVNTQTGGGLNISLDLPVTVDYNFGAGSSEENTSTFGFFVGAGFGYTYTNQTIDYYTSSGTGYESLKGVSYGPLAHAGLKLAISDRIYFLRAFYKVGLEKQKFTTVGTAIGVSF